MTGVDADLATLREHLPFDYLGPDGNDMDGEKWGQHPEALAALDRVEAEIARLTARRSRYAEARYENCMEALSEANRELLQQQSFMERKLAAQREDIERLATRVETAEAKNKKLSALIVEQEAQYRKERRAAEAALADTRRQIEYVEGVLMRNPFDDGQRRFAAELLRRALAEK